MKIYVVKNVQVFFVQANDCSNVCTGVPSRGYAFCACIVCARVCKYILCKVSFVQSIFCASTCLFNGAAGVPCLVYAFCAGMGNPLLRSGPFREGGGGVCKRLPGWFGSLFLSTSKWTMSCFRGGQKACQDGLCTF